MNMAAFFISRPVLAWVVAILISLFGVLAILRLPLEQYPDVAPPSVTVNASFLGASAETAQNTVTQVIERQLTGLDHLLYMTSSSSASGGISVVLTFDSDVDPDIAQVQVQNKVAQAEPLLPGAVRQAGVTVSKSVSGMFMVVAFTSPDGSLASADISDYVASNVLDSISRVDGVGGVVPFGGQYAMRIWLDPERLNFFELEPGDVITAINAQNADVSSGALGDVPAVRGQQLSANVTSRSKLRTVDEFERIVLRAEPSAAVVTLKDVAKVEIGSDSYLTASRYNGLPASGIGVQLAPGANALRVAQNVKALLAQRSKVFPQGLAYEVAFDTTPFIKTSIFEVVKTLLEAAALVALVMWLFLQSWRATLIPLLTMPVVLLGTFGVLAVLGYSINTLTLLAMVVAIGLLVDDAIVVVENVDRIMRTGVPAAQATRRAMSEIAGALFGITVVLCAVFVPMAFLSGTSGAIYRQFSVAIVTAMLLSLLMAQTLSPALCATLLGHAGERDQQRSGRFGRFNCALLAATRHYQRLLGRALRRQWLFTLSLVVLLILGGVGVRLLPSSYLPTEDQGTMMVLFSAPPGSTQERTLAMIEDATELFRAEPEVESVMSLGGYSFAGSGQSTGMAFVRLKDWRQRNLSSAQLAQRINIASQGYVPDLQVTALVLPPIMGLGTSSGFSLQLQDVQGQGHQALVDARERLIDAARQSPALSGVYNSGLYDAPTLRIDIDDAKAGSHGVASGKINDLVTAVLAGVYVNDFVNQGRLKRVYVQGKPEARMQTQDLERWYLKASHGGLVSLASLTRTQWTEAAQNLTRFNGFEAMEISGSAAGGLSTGQAMGELERLNSTLGTGMELGWSGASYQERASGMISGVLFAASIVLVFLCLAALYESWRLPLAIIAAAPIGLLGAVLAAQGSGMSNDLYFQIALLAMIGLAAKNGILIVEYARRAEYQGSSLHRAVLVAAGVRLRPLMMTSLAFIISIVPLAFASGPGAEARTSLGTGMLGGTILSTALGIVFVPLMYRLVGGARSRRA